jgi:hypothetical protein
MAISALPWAEVFVDGGRVGETPIASLVVPIGVHEILFRHPNLGERTISVTVAVGKPTNVGVDFKTP